MRVLQLIDTLHAGGAERMAVNLANALLKRVEGSHLCATRDEGTLKSSVNQDVGYLFLNRKRTIDIGALLRLRSYIKTHQIDVIHAHSSSFFIAVLVKLLVPRLKIIWHDHYGKSEFLSSRPKGALRLCSRYFSQVISVNNILKTWAEEHLKCSDVVMVNNFVVPDTNPPKTVLYGNKGKRVLCLANLRPQKDHMTLLKAFQEVMKEHQDWTLHCVGKDFRDDYAQTIYAHTNTNKLNSNVYFYGSCEDITSIIAQCDIGVLSSKSEGLPLALLEYGFGKLATVSTDVGDCKKVITNDEEGILVTSEDVSELSEAIKYYIKDESSRIQKGEALHNSVYKHYSEEAVIDEVLGIYQKVIHARS